MSKSDLWCNDKIGQPFFLSDTVIFPFYENGTPTLEYGIIIGIKKDTVEIKSPKGFYDVFPKQIIAVKEKSGDALHQAILDGLSPKI